MEPNGALLRNSAHHFGAGDPARSAGRRWHNRHVTFHKSDAGKGLPPTGVVNKGWRPIICREETAMPHLPSLADLEPLRAFDTPTICNALELVVPARRAIGFTRRPLTAAFPHLKPVVAFARTAIIRAREPHPRGRDEAKEVRLGYYAHIAAEPLPSIAVIQDVDAPDTGFGAFWGEVQSHIHKGLGCAGVITDGSVRDL